MLRNTLTVFFILNTLAATCPEGCLKCEPTQTANEAGKCEICDLTRFYYESSDGTCVLKPQSNCAVPALNPDVSICYQCEEGFYLDQLAKKCAKVPDANVKQNCAKYSPSRGCMQCSGDYMVRDGECAAVANPVSQCHVYLSDGSCGQCRPGFVKNDAGSECVEFKLVNNCKTHTNFTCAECKLGYQHAFNIKVLKDVNVERVQKNLLDKESRNLLENSNVEECIQKKIPNCLIYDSYGRCGMCDDLYYPDKLTGNCVLSPESAIFMCKHYKNQTKCAECHDGFFISGDKCILRTKTIPHCVQLDPEAELCVVCHEDYYQDKGECKVREKSLHIFNCAKVSLTEDLCETCAEGFLQRGDKLACYTPIPNCDLHAIPADDSTTLKCTTCNKDTIPEPASPDTTVCRLRNKPNCREFTGDRVETCQKCSVNFYLDSQDCHPYTKICKERNPIKDECLTCYSYQYKKDTENTCHNYNVKNCDEYEENKDECKTCLPGHYKDVNSKDCVLHHLINCKKGNDNENKCDDCMDGYRKLSDIECTKTDLFGCETPDPATGLCNVCSTGFYLESSAPSTCAPHQLPGCKPSGMTTTSKDCSDCEDGFYLKGGKCHLYTVTHCKPNQLNQTEDECTTDNCQDGYYLTDNKQCEPITKFNCTLNTSTGKCDSCTDNSYFLFEGGCYKKMLLGCETYNSNNTAECTACKDGYYLKSSKCVPLQLTNCKVPDKTDGTCTTCEDNHYWDSSVKNCLPQDQPGCETYTALTNTCTSPLKPYYKLNAGNEAVPLEIQHCLIRQASPNEDKCEICKENYYSDSGGTVCTKQPDVPNCLIYKDNLAGCKKCKNLFYIPTSGANSGTCQAITDYDCVESNGIDDVCSVCGPAFFRNNAGACNPTTDSVKIENCYGNDSATDVPCKICKEGFMLTDFKNMSYPKPLGAASATSRKVVSRVKPGYECTSSIDCFPIRNPFSKCFTLQFGKFTSIDTDGSCAACRNPNTHWNDSKTCKIRTNLNCGVFIWNADDCHACSEGLQYNNSGNSNNDCTEPVAPDDSSHCKYTYKGAKGCYLCREGYVRNVSAKSVKPDSHEKCIVAADNDERRCREVNDNITSGGRCRNCRDGYIFDVVQKICVENISCERDSQGFCIFCYEDYHFDGVDEFMCKPKLQKDECKIHRVLPVSDGSISNVKNVCVKCKDHGMIPVNTVDSSNNLVGYKCVKMSVPEFQYNFVLSGIDGNSTIASKAVGSSMFPVEITTDIATHKISDITDYGCLDMRMPNCAKMNFENTGKPYYDRCEECDPYYYLSPDNGNGVQCLQGSLIGCKKYVSQYVCSECEHGYYKNSKNFCTEYETIDFCEVYNPDNYGCLTCSSGYTVMGGECVESAEKNCKHFMANDNVCLECETGFYMKSMWCFPYSVGNCEIYSKTNDQCLHCQTDYYLEAATGKCLRNNSRGCKVYSKIKNECLVCDHNYFLLEDTHVCRPYHSRNCVQYNPVNGECVVCDQTTFLSAEGNCQPYTLDNCDDYHPHDDTCLKCSYGYFVNYFGTCSRLNLTNCNYSDPRSNRCLVCSAGHYLQTNGYCAKYSVRNCSLFNRNRDECLDCLPNYFLSSGGTCLPYENSMNCQTLNPYRDECSQCLPGHYLTLNKCVKYTITHCAIYKNDADQCVDCLPGFFLMDNLCHPYNMVNCKQFSLTANECTSCDEDQYLEDGLCKVNSALFCAKKSTQSNTCLECPKSFYNDSGVCLPRIESNNCMETEPTMDRCKKCYETHYYAGGRCISYARKNCLTFDDEKDLCKSCEAGKFWMSNKVCEPYTVKNCEEFNPDKDACLKCESGPYYLMGGKCVNSTIVNNCKTYSGTEDKCMQCVENYYFASETECRVNPAGIYKCIKYKDQDTCIKCEKGFYVETHSTGRTYCERSSFLIDVCLDYSGEKKCKMCEPSYFLVENECVLKTELTCLTWKSPSECQTCPANFVLKKNSSDKLVCEPSNIENCESASLNSEGNATCAKCIAGYFPDNNQCVLPQAPINACLRYVKEGECELCQENFTLSTSKKSCTPNSIYLSENCSAGMEHTEPVCKLCNAGYILNSDGQCDSCGGEGCDVCDPWDTNRCLLCKGGYNHDGQKCSAPTQATDGASQNRHTENGLHDGYKSIERLSCLFLGVLTLLTLTLK